MNATSDVVSATARGTLVTFVLGVAILPALGQSACPSVHGGTLFPSDGASGNTVGTKVALSAAGDRVAMSGPGHTHNGILSGAVWVISDPGTGTQSEAELIPSLTSANMGFGYSLAMNAPGDVVVVGAPRQAPWPGQAYVFRFDGTNWYEEWRAIGPQRDSMGSSVAIDAAGNVIAVGAPMRPLFSSDYVGVVEVFRFQLGGWTQEAALRPSDPSGVDGLGAHIAMSADGTVIATRSSGGYSPPLPNGAVYLFERTNGAWTQVAKLQEPIAYSGGGFGIRLSLDGVGQTLAAGNYQDSRLMYLQGAVTMFRKGGSGWAYDTVLLPTSPNTNGNFGFAVALNAVGDRLLVGAPLQELGNVEVGGVEEFELTTGGWQSLGLRFAPAPEHGGFVGWSVAASATARRWATGEMSSNLHGPNAGQVHVFDAPCLEPIVYCTAQTNSLGCVPQIGTRGAPSKSTPSGFTISASNTRNQQTGMLFYGTNGRATYPWNGGTLCVEPPLRRTPLLNSGGAPHPALDCSGVFERDFNDWAFSGVDPSLYPGQHVRAQFYARDPAAPSHVNLTDAVEFYLEP